MRVQEVESGKEELDVLVVESDERKEYEERQRQRSMKRADGHLKKVKEGVAKESARTCKNLPGMTN